MFKYGWTRRVTVIFFAVTLTAGCGAPLASSPTPSPSVPAAGQLAEMGKAVFASRCVKCHGADGQGVIGPAVIGANANLGKFNTAQGLFDFISAIMPGDAPGTLSRQEYVQVEAFLLVQNGLVSAGSPFDAGRLDGIALR